MRLLGCVGTLTVLVVAGSIAAAQPKPGTTAKADQLFEEGRKALDEGRYAEACGKFEASLAEADALGTRLNLALCMEKRGRVYTAMVKFQDAAARAEREKQPQYAKVAQEHAEAMRPLVPYLTVQVTSPVPGQKVVIKRQNEADREVLGTEPIPLDPTDLSRPEDRIWIEASAAGYTTHKTEPFTVPEKAKQTITIPALSKGSSDGGSGPAAGGKSRRKLYAYITAGAGVALMAGSGIWAYTMQQSVNDYCERTPTDCVDTGGGVEITQNDGIAAKQTRIKWHSSILFFTGVAAVGAGVFLYVTAPSGSERRDATAIVPTVGPDGGGLSVIGKF